MAPRAKQKKTSFSSSWTPGIVLAVLFVFISFSFYIYQIFFASNIDTKGQETYVIIPTGATYEQAMDSIESKNVVGDRLSLRLIAKLLKYPELVKPGFYEIPDGATNYQLIAALRSGRQTPVQLTFQQARLKRDLVKKLATYIEADEAPINALLSDPAYVGQWGFDTVTVLTMFIPNTYELYYTTTPKELLERMHKEYLKFWTPARLAKAKAQGLNPVQVSVLASIVQGETQQNAEKPRIAGVYLNRLRSNRELEADPTLVYAAQDFTIRRVLNKYKAIDSPYNTYMHKGLPPGPINIPNIASLEAVLNAEKHEYVYFCAKEDFSGFHNFAQTYDEHYRNAKVYQQALNKARIL